MKINIISTINGLENEGMRNIATHLAKSFQKCNTVFYSSFTNLHSIIKYSLQSDVTFIFARCNVKIYYFCRFIEMFCKNIYIVLVQKPHSDFIALTNKRPLKCSYFTISLFDASELKIAKGYNVYEIKVGIDTKKFSPVSREKSLVLKEKYGFNKEKLLVVHVGHCSEGRGLEDFCALDANKFDRMVVASGMFQSKDVVKALNEAEVKLHIGFISNINEIYQMADVYLFPTRSNEFVISIPLSILEALSCGTPVVAYRDFSNITFIKTTDPRAIRIISNKDELNSAVEEASKFKKNITYLFNPPSWCSVADEILQKVKENIV